MNFYILSQDFEDEEEDAMLAGSSVYLERIDVPFDEGEVLPLGDIMLPIEILIKITSLRGRMTDNLFVDDVNCPLVSQKAKAIFEKKNIANIQTLPLVLVDEYSNAEAVEEAKMRDEKLDYKKVVYENYEILNITGLVDCVGHDASNLEYFSPREEMPDDLPEDMKAAMQQEEDNDIDFIRKLVLDENKIPEDIKIFRLKDCPRILVFKEEIVKAIREAELTGFVFIPLSEYTDEIPDDDDEEDEAEKKDEKKETLIPQAAPQVEEKIVEKPKRRKQIVIKKITKKE